MRSKTGLPQVIPDAHVSAVAEKIVGPWGASPAAVAALVTRSGERIRVGAAGALEPGGSATTVHTPFDLASVTKSFTALAAARLVRRGVVRWSDRLGQHVGEAVGTPTEGATLELLLSHRAGLDGHRQLYAPLVRGEPVEAGAALREAAHARRGDCIGTIPEEGFPSVYSDLGYLLAGVALARAAGCELGTLVRDEVARPLGLLELGELGSAAQLEADCPGLLDRVAPTELVPWRGGVIRGVVHDENAFALAGSRLAGHAGLFGAAAAVAGLGARLLEALSGAHAAWLTPSELGFLLRDRPHGSYVLGFDRRTGDNPSSGRHFGPRTFGHLGFTGTSLWIDPDAGLAVVLLTNRVHPTREHLAIRAARPAAHDALLESCEGRGAGAPC